MTMPTDEKQLIEFDQLKKLARQILREKGFLPANSLPKQEKSE